ncbi:MAG: NAD(P)/FAD-dependent oxidoreductase, partial [Lachnospiraceae bacterium]|nr:NAD(P)/FAD-dependent oxidoreductase [Lachnospiraceae bacterium]
MKTTQVLVIGAGASGLMAGIMAARSGAKVVIAEQKDRPGRKILATGNGRCNFTNAYMDAACYHDNAFAMQVIRQFPGEQTLAFFRELGIYPVSIEGYYYPASMQASSVLAALLGEAERAGVKIMTYARVVSVSPAGRGEARSAAATGSTATPANSAATPANNTATPANSAATPDGIAGSGRKGCGEAAAGLHQGSAAGKETAAGFIVRIERTIPEGLKQKKKKNGKVRSLADSFRIEVEDWFCRKLILAGGG